MGDSQDVPGRDGIGHMTLTTAEQKAIRILDGKKMTPKRFALEVWPNSDSWDKVSNCGGGTRRGSGIMLKSGQFLRRLYDRGLVDTVPNDHGMYYEYTTSPKGRKHLKETSSE